jgi:hypothetical protein
VGGNAERGDRHVQPPLPLEARRQAHGDDERAVHRVECGTAAAVLNQLRWPGPA